MEKFEIDILGCGSALPTTKHLGSAQVVNIREKYFMIDCAEGVQLQLRRGRLRFSKINNIFISHLHGDHCFGLLGLVSTFGLLGRTAPLHIYAPKQAESIFRQQINFFCKGMNYEILFHVVDTTVHEVIYEDRSLMVYSIPLNHRIPCCGFLFKEKENRRHINREAIDAFGIPVSQINNIKAGMDYTLDTGEVIPNHLLTTPADPVRSYAYCSDTMFVPDNAQFLDKVDLLYHEATFCAKDEHLALQTGHSTALQAGQMAVACNAGRLVIGHFSARYDDENVLLKEAKTAFPDTILAKEYLKLSI